MSEHVDQSKDSIGDFEVSHARPSDDFVGSRPGAENVFLYDVREEAWMSRKKN